MTTSPRPRLRLSAALRTAVLVTLAALGHPREGGTQPPVPADALGPSGACSVAFVGGETLTRSDVWAVQAQVQPTPTPAAAARLLVDAALSHRLRSGTLSGSPVSAWLASYRDLHTQMRRLAGPRPHIELVLQVLARAKIEHPLSQGDCGVEQETKGGGVT